MSALCTIEEFDVIQEASDAFAELFSTEFELRSKAEKGRELYERRCASEHPAKPSDVEKRATKAEHDAHRAADWIVVWSPRRDAMQRKPPAIRRMRTAPARVRRDEQGPNGHRGETSWTNRAQS